MSFLIGCISCYHTQLKTAVQSGIHATKSVIGTPWIRYEAWSQYVKEEEELTFFFLSISECAAFLCFRECLKMIASNIFHCFNCSRSFLKYAIKYHLSLTDLYILMLFGREQYLVLCCNITFHYLYLQAAELALESGAEGLLPSLRFLPA